MKVRIKSAASWLLGLFGVLAALAAHGACSPDVGRVVLNEYAHQLNFAEIKRLNVNTDITNWKIRVYRGVGVYAERSLPGLSDPNCTSPYIYQTELFGSNETPYDADIVLLDANNDVVDVLQARRNLPPTPFYTPVPSCSYISPPIYVQVDPARKGVDRMPDGTGPWRNTPGTGAGSYITQCQGNTPSGPAADLAVTKTASPSAISTGGQVTFTVTLRNNGPNPANTIIVSDPLPAGLSYVSSSVTAGSYNASSGIWAIGTLANGASATLTLTANGPTAGSYTNTAQASSDNTDANLTNNLASATVTVGYADLSIAKAVDNASVTAGANVTFTLTATNNGPATANSVVVSDLLPAGLVYQSHSATAGTYTAGTGVWAIGNMASGASAPLTIVAQANASATNTATISSTNNVDTVPENNSASVAVTVIGGTFDAVEAGNAKATPIYTKLAGTAFNLDVLALNMDGSMQTGYNRNPTVELVSVGAGVCSGWSGLPDVTVAPAGAWSGGRRSYQFTASRASANARVRVTDGAIVACSTDNFAIRPAGFSVDVTKADGTALPSPIKAGLDMKATVQTAVPGYAGTVGFYPSLSLDQNGAAVAGRGMLTLANAANTQLADVPTPLPPFPLNDGWVFAGISSGVATVLPENAAYGAPVAPVTGFRFHDVGTLNLAIRDKIFTAVDRHPAPGVDDCVPDSASNTLAGGKYGCDIGGDTLISRFIPDHFSVAGSFAPTCVAGGFSYMDQPSLGIALSVSAQSASGIVSTLYGNPCPTAGSCKVALTAYNGTSALDIGRLKPLADFPAGTSYDAALTPKAYISTTWVNGQYAVSGANFYLARGTAPDGAFDDYKLSVAVTDPDSVIISGSTSSGATKIRYGRIALSNAHGSELLDLPVPMLAQYWNGSWLTNTLDTCTAGAGLSLLRTPVVGSGLTWDSTKACAYDSGSPGDSGIGCSTVSASCAPSPTCKTYSEPPKVDGFGNAGNFNLNLKASGAGNSGAMNLKATVPVWLKFNWKGTGDDGPTARITFGVYKGSPIIYMRETY